MLEDKVIGKEIEEVMTVFTPSKKKKCLKMGSKQRAFIL